MLVWVTDPFELQFPQRGRYSFIDKTLARTIDGAAPQVQQQHRDYIDERRRFLQRIAGTPGIRVRQTRTGHNVFSELARPLLPPLPPLAQIPKATTGGSHA
jgi:hypothetical protein